MNFNWEITGITGDRQQQEQLIFCLENVYVYLNHARTINLSWTWKTVLQTYRLHAWNRWKQSNKPTATLFNIHPASPSSKNCTRCEEKTHTKKKKPKKEKLGNNCIHYHPWQLREQVRRDACAQTNSENNSSSPIPTLLHLMKNENRLKNLEKANG